MPRRPGVNEVPLPKKTTPDQAFDQCPYCDGTFLRGVGNRSYFVHLDACEKYDQETARQAWIDGAGTGRGNKRHGTPSQYEKGGCRCKPCREAHRKKAAYYKLRKLEKQRQEVDQVCKDLTEKFTRSVDPENPAEGRQ